MVTPLSDLSLRNARAALTRACAHARRRPWLDTSGEVIAHEQVCAPIAIPAGAEA